MNTTVNKGYQSQQRNYNVTIEVAINEIKRKNDCVFIILGIQWSDTELLEVTHMEGHKGIILIHENKTERIKFQNEILCQVTLINEARLLQRAEGVCKKPIHTDCLTVLILNRNANTDQRLMEESKSLTVSIVMLNYQESNGLI